MVTMGSLVHFEYHGVERTGRVEKFAVSAAGREYMTVKVFESPVPCFKNFYVDEMIML